MSRTNGDFLKFPMFACNDCQDLFDEDDLKHYACCPFCGSMNYRRVKTTDINLVEEVTLDDEA